MAGLAPPSVPTLGANLLPTLCMSQTLALKLQETKPTLELGFKEQPLTFVPATLGIPPQTKLRMLVKLGTHSTHCPIPDSSNSLYHLYQSKQ